MQDGFTAYRIRPSFVRFLRHAGATDQPDLPIMSKFMLSISRSTSKTLLAGLLLFQISIAHSETLSNFAYDPASYPDPTSGNLVLFGGDLGDSNYAGGSISLRAGQHHIPGRHFVDGDGWWVIACDSAGCNLSRTALQTSKSQHNTYDGPTVPSQTLSWEPLPYGLVIDRQPEATADPQPNRSRQASDATLIAIFKPMRELSLLPLRENELTTWWYSRKLIDETRHPYAYSLRPATKQTFDLGGVGELNVAIDTQQAEQPPRITIELDGLTQSLGDIEVHMMERDRLPIEDFVQWIGDLDGDGKPDLVINHSAYFWDTRLWLSSLAKEGELVGEAGRFVYSPPDSAGC